MHFFSFPNQSYFDFTFILYWQAKKMFKMSTWSAASHLVSFFFPSSSYASYSYILLILLLKKRKRKHNFMIYICEKTNDYKWHLLLWYTERGTRRVCAAACQTCSCVFLLGVLTCRDPDEGKSVPVLRDRRGVVHWWVAPVLVCGERQTPECESHARLLQHHADTPN